MKGIYYFVWVVACHDPYKMIVEDFYSAQSRLRQEQAELLSLLKDDSCTWPSSSLNKETEGCSSSLRHQKMKADSKRPSRPPGSASCSTSGSPNTSMSEDDEDGCEIVRHHRRRPRTSARSVTTKPPTAAALEAEKSIYHSGCNPKQPNRSFRARPVPRGILKGKYISINSLHIFLYSSMAFLLRKKKYLNWQWNQKYEVIFHSFYFGRQYLVK